MKSSVNLDLYTFISSTYNKDPDVVCTDLFIQYTQWQHHFMSSSVLVLNRKIPHPFSLFTHLEIIPYYAITECSYAKIITFCHNINIRQQNLTNDNVYPLNV